MSPADHLGQLIERASLGISNRINADPVQLDSCDGPTPEHATFIGRNSSSRGLRNDRPAVRLGQPAATFGDELRARDSTEAVRPSVVVDVVLELVDKPLEAFSAEVDRLRAKIDESLVH